MDEHTDGENNKHTRYLANGVELSPMDIAVVEHARSLAKRARTTQRLVYDLRMAVAVEEEEFKRRKEAVDQRMRVMRNMENKYRMRETRQLEANLANLPVQRPAQAMRRS